VRRIVSAAVDKNIRLLVPQGPSTMPSSFAGEVDDSALPSLTPSSLSSQSLGIVRINLVIS
jgi:hypothetical protein